MPRPRVDTVQLTILDEAGDLVKVIVLREDAAGIPALCISWPS